MGGIRRGKGRMGEGGRIRRGGGGGREAERVRRNIVLIHVDLGDVGVRYHDGAQQSLLFLVVSFILFVI